MAESGYGIDMQEIALGKKGATLVTTTDAVTGTFGVIQMLSSAVFASITDATLTNSSDIASAAFPAGMNIYGTITGFTLTSGDVIAYNK